MSNPAKRLHALLIQGRAKDNTKPAQEVWSDLLQIRRDDMPLFWSQMAKVMELPLTIKEKILQHAEVDPKLALRWMPKVDDAFRAMAPQREFHHFITKIDDTTLFALEICSDILERKDAEIEYDEEELKRIQTQVNQLSEEITRSGIAPEVRKYLLALLSRVGWAIREHRISGPQALRTALESLLGSVALEPEAYLKSKETEPGKKAWELVKNLAVVVQIAVGVVTIADKIVHALPSSNAPAIEVRVTKIEP